MNVSPRLALQIGAVATLLLTVLAGLVLVTYQAVEDASNRGRERLRLVSSVVRGATEDDVNQGAAVAGLFESSRVVTAAEFALFAHRSLAAEPSLNALSFTERVDAAQRAEYERRTGFPIRDPSAAPGVAAPARGVYYPITYAASQSGPPGSLGVRRGRRSASTPCTGGSP